MFCLKEGGNFRGTEKIYYFTYL